MYSAVYSAVHRVWNNNCAVDSKRPAKGICSYTDKTYIALSCNLYFKVVNMVKSFDSLLYLLMFHVLNSL